MWNQAEFNVWQSAPMNDNQTCLQYFRENAHEWLSTHSWLASRVLKFESWAEPLVWTLSKVNPAMIEDLPHPEKDNEVYTVINWDKAYHTLKLISDIISVSERRRNATRLYKAY